MTLYETLANGHDRTDQDDLPGLDAFAWGRAAARVVDEEMRRDGAHDAGHLARVLENARSIARGERDRGRIVDWEVVCAGVLFHDVINPPKDSARRESASQQSAGRAVSFFEGRDGWTDRRLRQLSSAIERHSFSRGLDPETTEGEILRDADRLEAIGAVGIARCFYVSGAMEGAIADAADPFADERSFDDEAYAIDHFFEKLLNLRGTFCTETGRRLAEERHDFLLDFLEQFASEVGRAVDVNA